MKTCTVCGLEKPFSDFYRNGDGLHPKCKVCHIAAVRVWEKAHRDPESKAASNRAWRAANRERFAAKRKAWKKANPTARYGVLAGRYAKMLEDQNGVCAICKQECASGHRLGVDHDHSCCASRRRSCGRCVRGLLCRSCNSSLSNLGDSIDGIRQAQTPPGGYGRACDADWLRQALMYLEATALVAAHA